MFSIFGIEETVKNVYMLSSKFMAHKNIANTHELKPFYLEFLREHQPKQRIPATSSISFIANDIETWEKLNDLHHPNALDDMSQQAMVGETYSTYEQERHLQASRLSTFNCIQHRIKGTF